MKSEIREILLASVKKNYKKKSLDFDISRTKTKSHGNWSSNVALILGKELKQQPKIINSIDKNCQNILAWLAQAKIGLSNPAFCRSGFSILTSSYSYYINT